MNVATSLRNPARGSSLPAREDREQILDRLPRPRELRRGRSRVFRPEQRVAAESHDGQRPDK
jgi:hypothetical protein